MADIAADERLLSILQDLIRIRSCEPGWDELDVVRYLESLFAPFSVQKNIIHHGANRASMVISLEGKARSGRKLALMGHVDTMSPYDPGNWTYGPFSGHLADNKVYGIGSSNAKSGVAAMTYAALKILESGQQPEHDTLLCFTADSDGEGMGAKSLLRGGFLNGVTELMFCDPTGSDIGAAQKGALWLDFSVKGHSRHIMESRQSVNALSCALKFTEKLSGQLKKISSHRILGDCSVFLTQIRTNGNATWMIPGFVTGRIDVRVTPCIEIDSAKKIINDTRFKVEESMPGSSLRINIINERAPVGMASDAPLIQNIQKLCRKNGRNPKIIGQTFYTDASTLVPELGIPFVIIGPGGKIFNDREDENVSLGDLAFVSQVYFDYMKGVVSE